MTHRVQFTQTAEADIRDFVDYVANELMNPVAAERILSEIETTATSLRRRPERFPPFPVDTWARLGYRIRPVANCILVFLPDAQAATVTIVRVFHSSNNWTEAFLPVSSKSPH